MQMKYVIVKSTRNGIDGFRIRSADKIDGKFKYYTPVITKHTAKYVKSRMNKEADMLTLSGGNLTQAIEQYINESIKSHPASIPIVGTALLGTVGYLAHKQYKKKKAEHDKLRKDVGSSQNFTEFLTKRFSKEA